jgi:hypothetical protein
LILQIDARKRIERGERLSAQHFGPPKACVIAIAALTPESSAAILLLSLARHVSAAPPAARSFGSAVGPRATSRPPTAKATAAVPGNHADLFRVACNRFRHRAALRLALADRLADRAQ